MSDIVERLREAAQEIDNDGTPSQVGATPDELREAAAEIERLREWEGRVLRDRAAADAELTRLRAELAAASEALTLMRELLAGQRSPVAASLMSIIAAALSDAPASASRST